jgi:hypothetical protein
MSYLHHVDGIYHLNALEVQQALLRWREHDEYGLGRGITAMPSMHVSISFLFFILGFQVSRLIGMLSRGISCSDNDWISSSGLPLCRRRLCVDHSYEPFVVRGYKAITAWHRQARGWNSIARNIATLTSEC